ncbi:hypothetical protein NSZ01_25850 [Nocardioides szechwanensis]|uniref:ABC-2 type transport system ATP-binding protein n=1 Tax=Nocardioides szechwanensis TaxID=1005944 RepID=A0A1H0ALG9_9ACTN|nr:ATP-binding cassette domain-containing protein [Nocardioides szechwanensis]GEP34817.1 hypothetical protein NSZ01_25850 [Nocardioides szechwanensis]SDN34380.1 ABC-2 type transport system ATP-binding protein [Nocardioides szechwanensis]
MSGGQAQRLSIACALVHDPEVVFLDEPTAALDPQARRNLWDLLSGLNDSGCTVVLTTHYMDEAEVLCDRVAIMDTGRILKVDSPAALVRGLDAPARITVAPGAVPLDEARAIDDVDEMLDVMVRGEPPSAALLPILILAGFALVVTLVAARLFRWETT